MIKNIFRSALLASLTLLFFSCSFLEEKQTGSIVFDMSAVAARAATNTSFNSKDQMEIKLSGDYTAEKTFFIMDEIKEDNLIVTFDEIPVDAKIQAEATIFRVYNLSGRKDLYKGLSESIVIVEGKNQLPIQMKKLSSSASDIAEYTVQHYKQNIDDDNYTEVTADREEKTGVSLAQTNASPKSYTGFTAQPVTQKTIAEDSSTIVEIKYDRNTYTVSYEDAVANDDISVPSDTNNYRYGATVTVDFTVGTSTGHTFKGWKDPESGKVYNSGNLTSFEIGAADVTLYAQWEANTYNIVYNLNGGAWASGYTAPSAYTYGEPLNLPDADDIVLTGYGLTGWYTTSTFDTDTKLTEIAAGTTGTVEVYAQWTAGATTYKVHHLLQKVDASGYEEDTENLQVQGGISDTMTTATAKSYPGFTAQTISQQQIAGDGSTEITIKYDRDSHTVTYEDGVTDETISVPSVANAVYGATYNIDFTTTVSRAGYVFAGWKNIPSGTTYKTGETTSFPIGTEDVTLTAQWEAETQNTGIDVGFGVNTSTISVSNMSTGVYTATAGYDSYTWTLDGEEVTSTSAYLDASNPNILTLTSITVPGVYDITLTATKALSGTTVTHTWTGQYIKS